MEGPYLQRTRHRCGSDGWVVTVESCYDLIIWRGVWGHCGIRVNRTWICIYHVEHLTFANDMDLYFHRRTVLTMAPLFPRSSHANYSY